MKAKSNKLKGHAMAALVLSAMIYSACSKSDSELASQEELQTTVSQPGSQTTSASSGRLSSMSARTGLNFEAGFEGSTPFAGMSTVQTATTYGITQSTSQANEEIASFKSVVKKTDPSISSGYRSEITFPGLSDVGEKWYGYSMYFESIPLGGGHVTQWHPNNSNGSATLSLWTGDGKFMVVRNPSGTNINYYQPNPQSIITNKWYDIVWHVKWSAASDGLIEMWIDGVKYFTYNGVTAQTGVYFKLGQNLWVRNNDGIIYYDNLRIGGSSASYEAVAPETTTTSTPPVTPPTTPPATGIAPTVKPGADQTITLPVTSVTLDGSSSSDEDGTIATYLWTKDMGTGGTITSPNSASTSVTGLSAGSYRFRLKVTDNSGLSSTDTVRIIVNPSVNQLPVVSAGNPQTINLPSTTATLRGTASDPDGTIASYKWSKVSGPSGGGTTATTANANIRNLRSGTYVYNLRVTDNKGAIANSRTTVTVTAVPNQVPIVNAGAAQTISLPTNSATLRGTASDVDGTIASYQWTKVSGPAGGTTTATTATASISSLIAGNYTYKLQVTDDRGATASSTTTITVNPLATITTPAGGSFGTVTFQTGYDFSADINTNQGPRNSLSTTIKKTGTASFRSEVRASDPSTSSGYRGEMQYSGTSTNPTEGVVEYDVYYENWKNFGGGGHTIQWHPDNGNGSATLSLYSYNGKFQVVRNLGSKYDGANYYQSGTLQTIAPNTWINMRWEFKWATTGGYIRLYINNVLYYSYTGETMNSTTGMPYLKVGQNRWSMPSGTNTVVYYDNLKIYKK